MTDYSTIVPNKLLEVIKLKNYNFYIILDIDGLYFLYISINAIYWPLK